MPESTTKAKIVRAVEDLPEDATIEDAIKPLEDPVDPGFVREFQESTVAQPIDELYMHTIVEESLKVPARVWKATALESVKHDQSGELGKVRAPTLIIWGDQEELASREDQDEQVEAIPNVELKVYEGVGHGVHWEAPEKFASDVARFALENADKVPGNHPTAG